MMRTDTGHEVPAFLWAKGGHPFYETARRQVRRTRADHAYRLQYGKGGVCCAKCTTWHASACACACACARSSVESDDDGSVVLR